MAARRDGGPVMEKLCWEDPFKLNVFSYNETANVYKLGAWSFIGLLRVLLEKTKGT